MNRVLRGHHLLCIHGFRGMGYSPSFVQKMGEIVQEMKDPTTDFGVRVVVGLDDACSSCPHKGPTICEASPDSNDHVTFMDRNVLKHLGLEAGNTYSKDYLISLTAQTVQPQDLDILCQGCSWLPYGVCKEGIEKLRSTHLKQGKLKKGS